MPPSPQPVAIVTGAGSGIGRAAALSLARRGHLVVLSGRRREPLDGAAAEIRSSGGAAHVRPCDMADFAGVRALIDGVAQEFGRLDALVNNAGWGTLVPIEETGEELLRRTFAVNTIGPGVAIAAAWPHFRRQRRGCIVNVSTMGTKDPFPGFFAYAASKAALESFTRSCANEGRAFGVRAFSVAPGATETPMLRSMFDTAVLPRSAAMTPQAVADVIVGCVCGERDADNGGVIFIAP